MQNFTAPKLSKRFQMSYKEHEVEYYEQMENNLMELLHITKRCDLHKTAIKKLDAICNPRTYSFV